MNNTFSGIMGIVRPTSYSASETVSFTLIFNKITSNTIFIISNINLKINMLRIKVQLQRIKGTNKYNADLLLTG